MVEKKFPGRINSVCKDSEFRNIHAVFERLKYLCGKLGGVWKISRRGRVGPIKDCGVLL